MSNSLRIGLAGLGTVGIGVLKILETHADKILKATGRSIEVVGVHAREKGKDRGHDLSSYRWFDKPEDMAASKDIDVVVEVIGGDSGIAKELIENSLSAGKSVITANKALLAKHGVALAKLAEENDVSLNYEAAVAGGIPIIKSLREGFSANRIAAVYGILNGTCNYILSEMRMTGRDFDDVLAEAQEKGYAEADPTFDIDGIDAAHKLSILTTLAFGTKSDFGTLDITGIRRIGADDIAYAGELGYRIKLLGIARRVGDKIAQSLEPCLVPSESAMGGVEGVYNAVHVEGDFVGKAVLEGRGAGQGPTASAVLSDLIDIARGVRLPTFGVPVDVLENLQTAGDDDIVNEQYMHLRVLDQPGVIADVSAILKDYNISIESLLQRGRDPGQPVSVIIVTHDCSKAAIRAAIDKIAVLPAMVSAPTVLRIERM